MIVPPSVSVGHFDDFSLGISFSKFRHWVTYLFVLYSFIFITIIALTLSGDKMILF